MALPFEGQSRDDFDPTQSYINIPKGFGVKPGETRIVESGVSPFNPADQDTETTTTALPESDDDTEEVALPTDTADETDEEEKSGDQSNNDDDEPVNTKDAADVTFESEVVALAVNEGNLAFAFGTHTEVREEDVAAALTAVLELPSTQEEKQVEKVVAALVFLKKKGKGEKVTNILAALERSLDKRPALYARIAEKVNEAE